MFKTPALNNNESVLVMDAFGVRKMVEIPSARKKLLNCIQKIVQEPLQQKAVEMSTLGAINFQLQNTIIYFRCTTILPKDLN